MRADVQGRDVREEDAGEAGCADEREFWIRLFCYIFEPSVSE